MKLAAAIFLVAMLLAPAANAATCGGYMSMRGVLERYKEAPILEGTGQNGSLVEIWRTNDGKTWSITVTFFKDGKRMFCIIGSGEDLRNVIWHLDGAKA